MKFQFSLLGSPNSDCKICKEPSSICEEVQVQSFRKPKLRLSNFLIFVTDVSVPTIEEKHLPVRHMSLSIQKSHNDISECGKTKCYVVWVFRLGGAPKIYEMKTTSATSH